MTYFKQKLYDLIDKIQNQLSLDKDFPAVFPAFTSILEKFTRNIFITHGFKVFRDANHRCYESFISCYLDLLFSDKPIATIVEDLEKTHKDLVKDWNQNGKHYFIDNKNKLVCVQKKNGFHANYYAFIQLMIVNGKLDYLNQEEVYQMFKQLQTVINQLKVGTLLSQEQIKKTENPGWQETVKQQETSQGQMK